jgi:ParB family transcriptional regulator, chromosome partitioning protein
MHPADQFIAFHDLVVESGLSIDDVAARFGVSPLFVRQRLKLANVAPRFIKAYRAEEIRLDQLEAIAITDDQEAQEKVWDSLPHDWERSPRNLRSLLTEEHVSASDRRARFVGVDAYVAAGGTLERDLFDEENEGYLADRALLDRLVKERSTSLVADLQAQGWAWAEVHLENDYWEALEKYTTLRTVPVDLDPAAPEHSLEGSGGGRRSHRQRCPEPARRRFYRRVSCCGRLSPSTHFRHGQLVATHRRQLFRPHQEGPNSPSHPRSYRSSR